MNPISILTISMRKMFKAHGVYEGSYWELIGDCDEMAEMLRKLAKAPPLIEEPCLNLPSSPDLPK